MRIDGRCHCGLITYEAEVTERQRSAIARIVRSFRVRLTSVVAKPGNFRLLSGELKTYVKVGDSGRRRTQTFCGNCGSPIYSTSADDQPTGYNVRIGTIRQRDQFVPRAQIWCRSAQRWTTGLNDIPGEEREGGT